MHYNIASIPNSTDFESSFFIVISIEDFLTRSSYQSKIEEEKLGVWNIISLGSWYTK
jgi:hypothetical protein